MTSIDRSVLGGLAGTHWLGEVLERCTEPGYDSVESLHRFHGADSEWLPETSSSRPASRPRSTYESSVSEHDGPEDPLTSVETGARFLDPLRRNPDTTYSRLVGTDRVVVDPGFLGCGHV